jgi:hypothetical protein
MITVTRTFTLEDARKTLPLVIQIVHDILSTGNELKYYAENNTGTALEDRRVDELISRFKSYMQELEEIGCYYKDSDFSSGLVDFPATIDGKEVFICWKYGDSDIIHYHDIDVGYAGRKLIPNQYYLNN